MKSGIYTVVAFAAFIFFVLAYNAVQESHKSRNDRPRNVIDIMGNFSSVDSTNTSYEIVGGLEDDSIVSEGDSIWRYTRRISIPLGRSEKQLKATLRKALLDLHKEVTPWPYHALMILAYRPDDDSKQIYSAGKAVLSPNGLWADAAKPGPLEVLTVVSHAYTKPTEEELQEKRTRLVLAPSERSYSRLVRISKTWESWEEKDIIAKVPPGHPVKVIDRYSEWIADYHFVRIKIETQIDGKTIKGWVHDYNIED